MISKNNYSCLELDFDVNSSNGIATITLNRPKVFNALSMELMEEFISALRYLSSQKSCKVLCIFANGRGFCSGHDLKELERTRDPEKISKIFTTCSLLMQTVSDFPIPVIAGIEGIATAAGCQLVASCDLAVATKSATFATPGVNIGLFCSTPLVPISRKIPEKVLSQMLYTGESISAKKAKKNGLINQICKQEKVRKKTLQLAKKIASKPVAVIRLGKRAFIEQKNLSLGDAYSRNSKVMADNMGMEESAEGISALLTKRTPNWNQ